MCPSHASLMVNLERNRRGQELDGCESRDLFSVPNSAWETACVHAQLCLTLDPHGWGSVACKALCPWDYTGENTGSGVTMPSSKDLPDLGIKPAPPALVGGFLGSPGNQEAANLIPKNHSRGWKLFLPVAELFTSFSTAKV